MAREGPDVADEVPAARRHRVDDNPRRRLGQQGSAEPRRLASQERQATGGQAQRGRGARGAAGVPGSADRSDTARADHVRALRRRFLESCREKGRSPTTLRTYGQIVGEVKARWRDWRAVDVDADELEDYRDELAERGLAGSTLNQRRAVLSGIFKVARRRFRVNVDPMDGFERAEVKDSGDFEVYSVEEVWALVRAAGSGVHHSGQRAYTRTSKTGPGARPRAALHC
jgi:hypothetical protein